MIGIRVIAAWGVLAAAACGLWCCPAPPCHAADMLSLPGLGEAEAPRPVITCSAGSVARGEAFEVVADFKLAPGVKLYKDKIQFIWTRLDGAYVEDVALPAGERVADPLAERPGGTIEVYHVSARAVARLRAAENAGGQIAVEGRLAYQSCTEQMCFPPAEQKFAFTLNVVGGAAGLARLWEIALAIVAAFGSGILVSLTPCVYPMFPITAAVIGARRERGLVSALGASGLYVLGMALVYAVIGVLVATLASGPRIASLMQSAYVKVPIAALFAVLAVVMFKGIEVGVGGWFARVQRMLAGQKGLAATFVLGAVSGLVVSPCVAAPVGGILAYIATQHDPLLGFFMLFALAWGMGVPLIVFGTTSGLLPRAGEWMEWFKRFIGFVLLWAALYFLSTVIGQVAYRLAFAALLIVAAAFLGGFDALTRESSFGDRLRKVLGVAAVLCAAVLLFSALAGRSVPGATGPEPAGAASSESVFKPGAAKDVEAALAAGEPVVLDFYAEWCTICKVIERRVYGRPESIAAGAGLRMLKIDFDKEPELARKYRIFGPPAVVFIGHGGTVRTDLSFVGEKGLDEFVGLLKRFRESEARGAGEQEKR